VVIMLFAGPAGAQTPTGACPPSVGPSESAALGSLPAVGLLNPAPERIVACVGARSITGATFSHWASIARKFEGSSNHRLSTGEVIQQVMGFLLSSDWELGEATDLNLHVTEREVRHTFDRARAHAFPRLKGFSRFLKESGQTVEDLLVRVRVNLTSLRIRKRVLAGHRGARSRRRAVERFDHAFTLKWEAQTYCDPGYAVQTFGHVQVSL
jgi:hypothetical protein